MIKISLKGLAKYVIATPSQQRKILHDYKFPKDDESRAQAGYYREAREFIRAFHRDGRTEEWLRDKARDVAALAPHSPGRSAARLRHNARGLRAYADHFSELAFEVLPPLRLSMTFGNVRVSVSPDLNVMHRGKQRLVKLEFAAAVPKDELVRIVSQTMFEAARSARAVKDLTGPSIFYVDVPRGAVHKGARVGSRRLADIEAACAAIEALWPDI